MLSLAPKDWNETCAAHLLVRTCWGATPERIAGAAKMRLPDLLEELIAGDSGKSACSWPEKFDENSGLTIREMRMEGMDENTRRDTMRERRREEEKLMREIRGWWLKEMSATGHPLRENMTLFWHGHFVSSFQKVRNAHLMWRQNRLFREHALGSIRDLAGAVVVDPAMMRYLDLARNRASGPNENFARELFELFLLGEGNYSEEDIREAARAFTGQVFSPPTGEVHIANRMRDSGTKKIFGSRGDFQGKDVVRLAMEQPACAEFLAGKMWHYFSGKEASPSWARILGKELAGKDFQTAEFLRSMLGCREFYSADVLRKSIKSPVQWLVGTSRLLESPLHGNEREQFALNRTGQLLFVPPNVRGWEGGPSWINTTTLPARNELAVRLFPGDPDRQKHLPELFTGEESIDTERVFAAAVRRLFPVGLSEKETQRIQTQWAEVSAGEKSSRGLDAATLAKLVSLLLASPEYQIT
jgi:hypothetical protein